MKLHVEFFWDDEAHNWGFRVPSLHIIGGGQKMREEAEQAAIEAIEYALEPLDEDIDPENEIVYFDVQVTAAKVKAPAS